MPIRSPVSSRIKSSAPVTGWPLSVTIMSPVSRPERFAGLPSSDIVMVAAEPCARLFASCMRRGIVVCCAEMPM